MAQLSRANHMSYVQYIKQDISTIDYGVIAHGVNCQGVMGSGVAKTLRAKWPTIFNQYKLLCDSFPKHIDCNPHPNAEIPMVEPPLGLADIVYVGEKKLTLFVANMFTQQYYGRENKRYAVPIAIRLALEEVGKFAVEWSVPVYMPRVGCGLGGLDWDKDVAQVVEDVAMRYPYIEFFVCDI